MEGTLGDRSTREEKIEEVGDGREEGREEDTSIGIDASMIVGGEGAEDRSGQAEGCKAGSGRPVRSPAISGRAAAGGGGD